VKFVLVASLIDIRNLIMWHVTRIILAVLFAFVFRVHAVLLNVISVLETSAEMTMAAAMQVSAMVVHRIVHHPLINLIKPSATTNWFASWG